MLLATDVEFQDDVVIVHNLCVHCGKADMYQITLAEWIAWQVKGQYIQSVFPHKTADEREFMLNGTHPKCFEEMFYEQDA